MLPPPPPHTHTLRRSSQGILVSGCASVRPSVRSSRIVHARVLKFHIWIPNGNIADTHVFFLCVCFFFFFFFLVRVFCFGVFFFGVFWGVFFFLFLLLVFVFVFSSELSAFLELCHFEKIRMKSDAYHVLGTVHARVFKFHIWIPHEKMVDPYFFLSELSHFLKLYPLKKSE